MSPAEVPEDDFLALVAAIQDRGSGLSALAAALVAAISLDIARDSRTFAKLFGIEHALVLREINLASGPDCLFDITRRDARTQRMHLQLTVKGETIMASLLDLGLIISR